MSNDKPLALEDIIFEEKDSEIFNISDTRTRLDTLQNYFFPRLEALLRHSLELVQDVYGENPYDRMSFVYRPSHRKQAQQYKDYGTVHIGLAGKRQTGRELNIKRPDGTSFAFHPTYLTFTVVPNGGLQVVYLPFRQNVDSVFVSAMGQQFQENLLTLAPILANVHIAHNTAKIFFNILDNFDFKKLRDHGFNPAVVEFLSPAYYFPIQFNRGLQELVLAFVSMYPLLSASVSIGNWEEPKLAEQLRRLKDWLNDTDEDDIGLDDADDPGLEDGGESEPGNHADLPELDGYHFVRAGLRWDIFARDKWTCCSCGRSPRVDGVTLEVDHIIPRSKGGTNDKINLQTLCKKCNIGKSNRDDTNLRE